MIPRHKKDVSEVQNGTWACAHTRAHMEGREGRALLCPVARCLFLLYRWQSVTRFASPLAREMKTTRKKKKQMKIYKIKESDK